MTKFRIMLITFIILIELAIMAGFWMISHYQSPAPVYSPVVGDRALVQVVVPTNDDGPVWPSEQFVYIRFGMPILGEIKTASGHLPEVFDIVDRPARRDPVAIIRMAMAHEQAIFDQKELRCLATNIYHEARGEGRIGMVAVAWTTINRRDSPHFPNTICGVVYQPSQFAWIKEGHTSINEISAYNRSMDAARFVYYNHDGINDYTGGSLYFLSAMNNPPSWSRKFATTFVYRGHTFYKP